MASMNKKTPLGRPLPPASDDEFSADAMREWGNNQALVDAEKHGNGTFNGMLRSQVEPIEEDA